MRMSLRLAAAAMAAAFAVFEAAAAPVPAVGIWSAPSAKEALSPLPYANQKAPKGGALKLSSLGTFDNFNPYATRGVSAAYLRRTYETLGEAIAGDSLKMRGLLAESFDVAADKSYMDVKLRAEAKFSDGKPVTADDVIYTFNALRTEALPTHRLYYAQVESAKKLSDRVVRFAFKKGQNRELPLIVAQLPVLPAHWWKGKKLGDPQSKPFPGSGPYQVESYRMGSRVVLKRNPAYWGKDLPFNAGRYNFDRIEIDYFRDQTVAREALFAGDLDYYAERSIKDWELAYGIPAVKKGDVVKSEITTRQIFGASGVFMNTRRGPLKDIRVRRALLNLFDFEWLNRSLFYSSYTRCDSFFSGTSTFVAKGEPSAAEKKLLASLPGKPSGALPSIPVNDGSGNIRGRIAESVKLLEEAGYKLKGGRMVDAKGVPLKFSMPMPGRSMTRMFEPWVKNLARAGITLTVDFIDQTQYVSRVRQYDYDFLYSVIRESENPGNEQRYFWSSKAGAEAGSRNYAGIADPAIDAVIDRVISARTESEHRTAVLVLDRLLRAGCYVIPGWYSQKGRFAYRPARIAIPASWKHPKAGIDMSVWHKAGK